MNKTYQEYIVSIIKRMKELNYHQETINRYQYVYDSFEKYMQDNQFNNINEAVLSFLKTHYNIDPFSPTTKQQRFIIRCMNILLEFNRCGYCVLNKVRGTSRIILETENNTNYKTVNDFISYRMEKFNISIGTTKRYEHDLNEFVDFVKANSTIDIKDVTSDDIQKYVAYISKLSLNNIYRKLSILKVFFDYLYDKKIVKENLRKYVPKTSNRRRVRLPFALNEDQRQKVLKTIDRNSPTGKRDYAILLIAAQLGLRQGDIRNLTFNNFDWEKNEINLVTQKTGKAITLPITNDIGNAIIDYVKNARPNVDTDIVFLRQSAPFEKLGASSVSTIARNAIYNANLNLKPNVSTGAHLFRHTLASTLLSKGVDLPTVSEILTHSNTRTTMIYTHIDIDNLRECALEVPSYAWEEDDYND